MSEENMQDKERDELHERLGKIFSELGKLHPTAHFTLQVATPKGEGFDILTLYGVKDYLPMFLQAMADTAVTSNNGNVPNAGPQH